MDRYIVTTSFYILAEGDEKAIELAKGLAKFQNDLNDDICEVEMVKKANFGVRPERIYP